VIVTTVYLILFRQNINLFMCQLDFPLSVTKRVAADERTAEAVTVLSLRCAQLACPDSTFQICVHPHYYEQCGPQRPRTAVDEESHGEAISHKSLCVSCGLGIRHEASQKDGKENKSSFANR